MYNYNDDNNNNNNNNNAENRDITIDMIMRPYIIHNINI